jgi:hypothetical protein
MGIHQQPAENNISGRRQPKSIWVRPNSAQATICGSREFSNDISEDACQPRGFPVWSKYSCGVAVVVLEQAPEPAPGNESCSTELKIEMEPRHQGTAVDCPYPDDFVHGESGRGSSRPRAATSSPRTKPSSTSTPLLSNVPSAPRRYSNLGSAPAESNTSRPRQPAYPEARGRISDRDHATHSGTCSGPRSSARSDGAEDACVRLFSR